MRKRKRRQRPSKEEYYLNIAKAVAQRATCLRRIFGAVLVVDDEIRATGYCGAPRGAPNCIDLGYCEREKQGIPSGERYEYCKSVHAECNTIISVARRDAKNGILYLYGEDLVNNNPYFGIEPCIFCKRFIINAGIKKVITSNLGGDVSKFHVEDWIADESYMIYEGGSKDGKDQS